jgi:RHS repeat-associated protein
MTTDRNKGLKSVKYNYLNLPATLTGDNNKTIDYIYTANGQKVAKTAPDGTTTYYAGSFIYEESDLKKVLHSEGVVKVDGTPPVYQYYLKDHLGNTRVMVSSDNTTNQVNSYYPFGMHAEKYEQLDNKYLYNGKEFQDDKIGNGQLDWYDYGRRFYAADLGRWTTPDPLSENYYSHSPFHFSGNNPIRFVDLNGMNYDEWNYYEESRKLEKVSNKGGKETQYVNVVDKKGEVQAQTSVSGDEVYVYDLSDGVAVTNYDAKLPENYNEKSGYEYSINDFLNREELRKGENNPIRTHVLSSEKYGVAYPLNRDDEMDYIGKNWKLAIWAAYMGMALDILDPRPSPKVSSKSFSPKFRTNSSVNSLVKFGGRSGGTIGNPWRAFLKANKGKYTGRNWIKQATKDYYNSSFYNK